MSTQQRIRSIWNKNGHRAGKPIRRIARGNVTIGAEDSDHFSLTSGMYSGSDLSNITADFLGDWRSGDGWQRFDMLRVRNRSRQLERGNPWCVAFKRNMLNNILGFKGYHWKPQVISTPEADDVTIEMPDKFANQAIKSALDEFGKAENFTTRKRLSRRDEDRLLLSRLIFDGEIILRKMRGWEHNEFGFTWQNINPDYLDHNLNRVEKNGNVTRMGVEMHPDFRFPVAYWFLKRRPNDFYYDYQNMSYERYIRVPADEIIHIYLLTEDDEQTRGWPWVFAAAVALFRLGKYQEAALVNAAIGASRGVVYEKTFPEGFIGDPSELADDSVIIDDLPSGSALELPYGVKPHVIDMKYPDAEFANFSNAMLLTTGATFGTSYATTTGDLSKANFVSSRLGQLEEREHYMSIQEYLIEKWKRPGAEEELYRAILSGKCKLPIGKFDKFNNFAFTGRRWKFVQPVDDMKAKEMALNNLTCSVSDIIEETTQESAEDVFERISRDNKLMEKYNLKRIISQPEKKGDEPPQLIAPED